MKSLHLDPFPQPESNEPGAVAAALDALWNASDAASADEASDAFLWAVGDNHAGTFYPVVLGVLPEIERILLEGSAWAQRAVMESLIDLGGSFIPVAGHETYLGASVQDTLKAFIHALRPQLVPLMDTGDGRAQSATDLVELIDDQAT
jgi:hypothetical protein